jgi:hypothetical protein
MSGHIDKLVHDLIEEWNDSNQTGVMNPELILLINRYMHLSRAVAFDEFYSKLAKKMDYFSDESGKLSRQGKSLVLAYFEKL